MSRRFSSGNIINAREWNIFWSALPQEIKTGLLIGGVGAPHLLALAARAMQLSSEDGPKAVFLMSLGRELLLAAWESDPLNGVLAAQLLQFQAKLSGSSAWLDEGLVALLAAIKAHYREPAEQSYYKRLISRGDFSKIFSFLETQLEREPSLFWLAQARSLAITEAAMDWFLNRLDKALAAVSAQANVAAVFKYIKSSLCYGLDRKDEAFSLLATLPRYSSWLAPLELNSRVLWERGDHERASLLWRQILKTRPWQTNLILNAHDFLSSKDKACSNELSGRVALLIYSWNKDRFLDGCFNSLCASLDDWSFIVALDNGSTDDTFQIMSAWRERFSRERMEIVRLPVNIGAPAARNWLMSLPVVRNNSDWAVFLDDDAEMPPDWLRHMAMSVKTYPRASVYGCKVRDALDSTIIQSADLHLLPSRPEGKGQGEPFGLSTLHLQGIDLGQFDYIRPCLSVTGCCHMFRIGDLIKSGDFSLSLSPSQFDDLEHDLRMAARVFQDKAACYNGFLSIRHHNRTGRAGRRGPEEAGNALGNRHKLYNMFSAEEIEGLVKTETEYLEADLCAKVSALSDGSL